tara:strand:+ start:2098 stop:2760 length:663 start_codon:yes stop_codon:yes gene_type:complete
MNIGAMWSNGTPLRASFAKFGNPQKAEAYRSVNHTGQAMGLINAITLSLTDQQAGDAASVAAQKQISETSELRRELEDEVLSRLRSGELIGIGYDVPRRSDDEPKQVPRDAWTLSSMKWDRDEVKGNGLHLSAVRIVLIEPVKNKKVGRPGTETLIAQAFDELHSEGKIDVSKTIRAHFEVIRERVWLNNPSLNRDQTGLGDKALSKHLSPLFQDAKSNE